MEGSGKDKSSRLLLKAEESLLYNPTSTWENLLITISQMLSSIKSDEEEEVFNSVLEKLGEATNSDRCWIIEITCPTNKVASNTFEWCREDVPAMKSMLQDYPIEGGAPWIWKELQKKEPIIVNSVENLPEEAKLEKAICDLQGNKGFLTVPLVTDGNVRGLLGFDIVAFERKWNRRDVSLLQLSAPLIEAALFSWRSDQKYKAREIEFAEQLGLIEEGLLISDKDDFVLYVNQPFCKLVGYSPNELIGSQAYRFLMNSDCWDQVENGTKKRFDGIADGYVLDMIKKDGSDIKVEIHAFPYQDSLGTTKGAISIIVPKRRARKDTFSSKLQSFPFQMLEQPSYFEKRLSQRGIAAQVEIERDQHCCFEEVLDSVVATASRIVPDSVKISRSRLKSPSFYNGPRDSLQQIFTLSLLDALQNRRDSHEVFLNLDSKDSYFVFSWKNNSPVEDEQFDLVSTNNSGLKDSIKLLAPRLGGYMELTEEDCQVCLPFEGSFKTNDCMLGKESCSCLISGVRSSAENNSQQGPSKTVTFSR